MKIKIKNKGVVDINEKMDFVFQGGEGRIFAKNDTVFKIYHDSAKAIPEAKINELKVLDRNNIVKPEDVILLPRGRGVIGYTMKRIENVEPVCKLFTNSFRDRNGISPESTVRLVENIRNGIDFVHSKKCLIVDLNETNILVESGNWEYAYFIDVDSYQTPSFPATALMVSVRDYQSNGFSRLTDWYSFAILAFQLFIGIHPYKGRHPKYKKQDIVKRMKDGISVLDKDVSIPKAARSFSYIPSDFMNWFEQLFQKNKRVPPPAAAGILNILPVTLNVIDSTNNFIISFERDFNDKIISFHSYEGRKVCLTENRVFIDKKDYDRNQCDAVIFSEISKTPVSVKVRRSALDLSNLLTGVPLVGTQISAEKAFVVNNTLYSRYREKLMEISIIEMNGNILYSVKNVWSIMPKSSHVFNGVIFQNIMGQAYLTIPVPEKSWCVTKRVEQLDGLRVIDAKAENRVVIINSYSDGAFHRFIIRFDDRYEKYDCRIIADAENEINFTVLPGGVAVVMNNDGELEMFVNDPSSSGVTRIKDPDVDMGMNLCRDGSRVMFFRDNDLYQIKKK